MLTARFSPRNHFHTIDFSSDIIANTMPLRAFAVLMLGSILFAQDHSDWQALSNLHAGERVTIFLKSRGTLAGAFQAWTPETVTVASTTAKREDVAKLERYRKTGWGRRKTALVGAAIGGGGGALIGIAAGGCSKTSSLGPCFTRAETGAVIGVAGAVVGGIVGALLPHRRTEVVYSTR